MSSRRPLLAYAMGWLVAGAAVAVVLVLVVGGADEPAGSGSLPAVRQTRLEDAARSARCELDRDGRGALPVAGAGRHPARPAVYDRPPAPGNLVGALRRGIVVIHFRPDLPPERREELERVHAAAPDGTIVTPGPPSMPYAVAVTAYRRLLGCGTYTDRTIDALRLFRGRYLGSGPDR